MGIGVRSFFLNGNFHEFAFEVLRDFDVDNILFRLYKLEEFEHVCLFLIVKIIITLNLCKFFYTAIKISPNFVFKLVEAMALVLKENLLNYAEYAVWKIEEEPEFYRAGLILSDWETNYLNNITHPKRKLTWLASRFLLKQLIDTDVFVELLFDEHGKPYVTNFDIFVSLSHSNEHAAAIVSKSFEVGIDVEEPHRKIEIIKNKFLSTVELNIQVLNGRFGPYIKAGAANIKIPKGTDPKELTFEDCKALIGNTPTTKQVKVNEKDILKKFVEDTTVFVLKGRFGPYIKAGEANVKIPKDTNAEALTYDDCRKLIDKPASTKKAKAKTSDTATTKPKTATTKAPKTK